MEKVTWNKLVYQQGYFNHMITEFLKNKPLNGVKVNKIIDWLENMISTVQKEADK